MTYKDSFSRQTHRVGTWPTAVRLILASLVPILTLIATGWAWRTSNIEIDEAVRQRFDFMADAQYKSVKRRMEQYEQVLLSGAAMFNVNGRVTRTQWHDFISGLRVQEQYPGIQGIGLSVRIDAGNLETHVQSIRAEGFPQYSVRPAGVRTEYHSIIYLEPFADRNLRAFGYDMFSEPVRRAAMARARDAGASALSGKVTLVQETQEKQQAGVLLYVPVYKHGASKSNVRERRETLLGFVYAPFRMDDLMFALRGQNPSLRLNIYDNGNTTNEAMLFDDANSVHDRGLFRITKNPAVVREMPMEIAGRNWLLRFESTPYFEGLIDRSKSWMILVFGLVLSFLLAAITWYLSTARRRAELLVAQKTEELEKGRLVIGQVAEQFNTVIETAVEGIIIFDENGIIETFNPSATRIFGYPCAEVLGCNVRMLIPAYRPKSDDEFSRQISKWTTVGSSLEVVGQRKGSVEFPMELSVTVCKANGIPKFIGFIRDISDRKSAEESIRDTNLQLTQSLHALERRGEQSALLAQLSEFMQISATIEEACEVLPNFLDRLFPHSTVAVYVAASMRNTYRLAATSRDHADLVTSMEREDCWGLRRGNVHELRGATISVCCRHVHQLPENGYLCVPISAQGEMIGLMHVCYAAGVPAQEIESEKELAQRFAERLALALRNLELRESLKFQATRDPLTGLLNRRHLVDALPTEIARARRKARSLGVLIMDIDHFKSLNDTHGHDAGDKALQAVANYLQDHVRLGDAACRYGGEEFVVVMPEASSEVAAERADFIRQGIGKLTVRHDGRDLGPLTVSMGVAIFPANGTSVEALLQAADMAMYEAKRSGRNRVVVAGGPISCGVPQLEVVA